MLKTQHVAVRWKVPFTWFVLWVLTAQVAQADPTLRVTYAGSMGVVMDNGLGPTFAKTANLVYEGQGEGAYGMARLLASKKIVADVFVSITPGPMQILKDANLIDQAVPVASTSMVIAFNPRGPFAKQLQESRAGGEPWWKVLQTPGLRFGRTDPRVDPQGQNIIFTMMLASKYYRQPDLVRAVLGETDNPLQVFGEGGLLTRLESGQIDASSGYKSAVVSAGMHYIPLPDEINLSNPGYARNWYAAASFPIVGASGKKEVLHPQPLVFYAAVLKNAPNTSAAHAFVSFLQGAEGQAIFRQNGYGEPKGTPLY
ncbi:extracellular solute-binding protein [Burkholderia multivorans]|nr:extracellular solute-binding protein [Burkholderia multivorans]